MYICACPVCLALRPGRWLWAIAVVGAAFLGRSQAALPGTILRGQVRFQVLADSLVRVEYSPARHFLDAPSVAVVGRDGWTNPPPTVTEADGWLNVGTRKLQVHYRLDTGPFTAANLRITWTDASGDHTWKPGDPDEGNLGGVPGTLDNRSTTRVTNPGPLSRNGCYLLDDGRTAFFDPATDWVKPRPEPDSQDWYFLAYGRDYAAALGALSRLIGPVPMIPRWLLGVWFGSRAGYSADQWKMIVKQFRDERLPLDLLVLDSDSTMKMTWAGKKWDYEQMSDPREFFRWMKRQGVKVTVNEHFGPLTRDNDDSFETIRQALNLPPDTKEIPHNLADKRYAQLFMDRLHKPALDDGLAFWWQDGAANTAIPGLDPYLWTRHIEYTGTERITGKRTTAFCRLGPAIGSHRYGVFFTGDLHGVWESLPVLIEATVRGGNQLVPYMNNLCGGVFVVDLPVELYQRWVQFGAFSPVIWFHGLWGLRLPWEYGPEGEATYRTFAGLRYALVPYTYTCARIAHDTGLPLVRGLYLEFPDQEPAYSHNQQYLFGPDLLVAPVTQPSQGKPARKTVFLPAGQKWYDYFTGDIFEGGGEIVHECPIERMPVFVRAGSIVPSAPPTDCLDQLPANRLVLDIYAGDGPAAFQLYEDDGESLDYRHGAYAWTPLAFRAVPQFATTTPRFTLSIGPPQGRYPGMPARRTYQVRLHGLLKPDAIMVDGRKLRESRPDGNTPGWWWDSPRRTTTIHLADPLPTRRRTLVTIAGGGTFADALALQQALNLRQQVRQAKRVLKLRHAELLNGADIKKPPRVIRETEKIENELTRMVDNPLGLGAQRIDFEAMKRRVLAALTDQPFESNRAIKDIEPETIAATKLIENGRLTDDQLRQIRNLLRGANLPPWLAP